MEDGSDVNVSVAAMSAMAGRADRLDFMVVVVGGEEVHAILCNFMVE